MGLWCQSEYICVLIQRKKEISLKKIIKGIPIAFFYIISYFSQYNGHNDQFIFHLLCYI